ncbi:50S ribosomal protein L18 [Candidatus Collierbacteria bacterium]|nr:50S ribosomal protein L18 [Candidatus Collierbacteria bacterium]
MTNQKLINQRKGRLHRIRTKLKSHSDLPRLIVNRSNRYLFAQVLDQSGKVLSALHSKALKSKAKTKTETATVLGTKLAEMIKKNKISKVVLDRGPFRFHGRVKALAEALNAAGIKC